MTSKSIKVEQKEDPQRPVRIVAANKRKPRKTNNSINNRESEQPKANDKKDFFASLMSTPVINPFCLDFKDKLKSIDIIAERISKHGGKEYLITR